MAVTGKFFAVALAGVALGQRVRPAGPKSPWKMGVFLWRAQPPFDFAIRSGRDEINFIAGDYPAYIRQWIRGKILGTTDQDPYPQAYQALHMADRHFSSMDMRRFRSRTS